MEDYSTDEKLISEFNEAKLQIYRIHNILTELRNLREKGGLMKVRWVLDSFALELWQDAKRLDGEKETPNKENKEGFIFKLKNCDKNINSAIKNKNNELLYMSLVEKEILLREIQNAAGKGAKYSPADSDW